MWFCSHNFCKPWFRILLSTVSWEIQINKQTKNLLGSTTASKCESFKHLKQKDCFWTASNLDTVTKNCFLKKSFLVLFVCIYFPCIVLIYLQAEYQNLCLWAVMWKKNRSTCLVTDSHSSRSREEQDNCHAKPNCAGSNALHLPPDTCEQSATNLKQKIRR